MIFQVLMERYGVAEIEADNEDEALKKANSVNSDDVYWNEEVSPCEVLKS